MSGSSSSRPASARCTQSVGVPNYYGEQRFGREGGNVAQARSMFAGRRVERDKRSFLLSAARSQIFNSVLAARVEMNAWDTPLDGEIWALAGSRSWFGPEPFTDVLAMNIPNDTSKPIRYDSYVYIYSRPYAKYGRK